MPESVAVPPVLLLAAPALAFVVQVLKRLGWVDRYPKLTALVLSLAVSVAWAVKTGAMSEEGLTAAVAYATAMSTLILTSGAVLTYEAVRPWVEALTDLIRRRTEKPEPTT